MKLIDFLNENDRFAKQNGIQLTEVREGYARAEMTVSKMHLNGGGVCQGGALFTLADNAAGCAASTDGRAYVTQASDIHFIRAQASGVVRAEARVRHRGRSTVLVDVSLTGEDERLLATACFTFFCVDGSGIARNSPVLSGQA